MATTYTLDLRSNGNTLLRNSSNSTVKVLKPELVPDGNATRGHVSFLRPNGSIYYSFPYSQLEGYIVGGVPVAKKDNINLDITYMADTLFFKPSSGGGGVQLGETSTTAYRGDRGKIAYDSSLALDYRLATNYMIVKSGANTIATPRFSSGLPVITNTNSALVFQQAVNAIQTGLGGKIVFDGDFTFTDHVTITGFDGQFDPRVQVTIEGLGYQSRITQNTAGKNIFIFKNKISAIIRNMYLVVGANGASAILGDDTGTSPSFGEISIYEGVIENVKIQHSGTAEAFLLKNFFNIQVSQLDVISTTQDAIALKGTSTTGQNYGNSNFSFVHATGANAVGKSSVSLISDVPNHPLNLLTFSNLSIGFGNIGLYMRGATSCTFLMADIEYTGRNIVMANGASGVNTGNNKFVNMYLYTNVGGTAIECASNSFGNDFSGRIESDDATLTVINDTQQFQAANSYNLVMGYGLGANPTVNITSQAFTPFMMRKVFDNLTVMRGPYITPDLTALAQNVKPSTGNTRDLGDASNFWANLYAQNVRGNTFLGRTGAIGLSSASAGSGVDFYINSTGTKVGGFYGTSGNFTAQLGGTFTDNGAKIQTTSLSTANTATKTANYTVVASDYTVKGNTTAGAFNITLPTAVGKTGQTFVIKQIGTANTLTVNTTSSQTIDGATTVDLTTQYSFITVQSNGANWDVIGKG